MKISELIEELNTVKNDIGDVYCVIYADHGKSYESVSQLDILIRVDNDDEMIKGDDFDVETEEWNSLESIVVIYG
jgi:hypothetical protein